MIDSLELVTNNFVRNCSYVQGTSKVRPRYVQGTSKVYASYMQSIAKVGIDYGKAERLKMKVGKIGSVSYAVDRP